MKDLRPFGEQLFWINLYALAFIMPLHPFLQLPTKILIGSVVCIWLIQCKFRNITSTYLPYIILFSSLYLINIIGFFYSENTVTGLSRLSSRLSFLIFPVILLTSKIDEKKLKTIFGLFTSSVLCITLISLFIAYKKNAVSADHPLMYLNLSTTINHHPSYLSFLVIFSFFFLLDIILKEKRKNRIILLISIEIYLTLYLFLLISRGPIIGFAVAFTTGFVVFKTVNRKLIIALGVIAAIGLGTLLKVDYFRDRLLKPFTGIEEKLKTDEFESTSHHLKSWYCAVDILSDHHFFTGYGSGDERLALNTCYFSHNWKDLAYQNLDAHNEYLSCLLRVGITELLILLGVLGVGLYWSIRGKNIIYYGLTVVFMIAFLFTSINDFTAILLLSFFNTLLFYKARTDVMNRVEEVK